MARKLRQDGKLNKMVGDNHEVRKLLIDLYITQGLDSHKIAEMLGITQFNVMKRLRRLRISRPLHLFTLTTFDLKLLRKETYVYDNAKHR